uniref:Uncharacterized protein n=1 Tax=Anguilla anguilla TaxID=7936 RepID=A0A0E9QM94_ANGAN
MRKRKMRDLINIFLCSKVHPLNQLYSINYI